MWGHWNTEERRETNAKACRLTPNQKAERQFRMIFTLWIFHWTWKIWGRKNLINSSLSSEQNIILCIGDKRKDQGKDKEESGKMLSSQLLYFSVNQGFITNNKCNVKRQLLRLNFLDLHSLHSAKIKDNYLTGIFSEQLTSISHTLHQGCNLCCPALKDVYQNVVSLSTNKLTAIQKRVCVIQTLPGSKINLSK